MSFTICRKFLGCAAAFSLMTSSSMAAVILTGTTYSENFDGRIADATSVTGAFSATVGVQAPIPGGSLGTSGWDGTKIGGTGTAPMNFTVDDGNAISGALYSYGSTISGATPFDPERALGGLASGSNVGAFGVELVNNTGGIISAATINYTGEYWRSSTSATAVPNTLVFGYEVGAPSSATYLTSTTAAGNPLLDLLGPVPVATNAALNGNLAANQLPRAGVLTNLNWQPGQSLYLRWQDFNDQGNDAGLAVDSFRLDAVIVPEPTSIVLVLAGLLLAGLGGRSRR